MITEFHTASELLHNALDRYVAACSSIRNSCAHGDITNNVPPELAEIIANELNIAISYKARFQQSKAAISVARNCSSTIVPITALPTEILTRIFRLVVGSQRCHAAGDRIDRKNITFPAHPVRLSHVCSRWRQVALDAPGLWTHIDFPPFQSHDQRLMTRMGVYMARSRQSLLDVHVMEVYLSNQPSSRVKLICTHLIEFLQPVFTRIRSLHIELDLNTLSPSFCSSLISCCLAGCVPGTLTQLGIRVWGKSNARRFMESIDNPESDRSVILALPKQALEDLLFHLSILRLNGPIPSLSSRAYHGLVELRLGPSVGVSISESQLVAMLKSSPGLRILEFGTKIDNSATPLAETSDRSVHLGNLEQLIVGPMNRDELGSFLQLLVPGSKPLHISIPSYHNDHVALDYTPIFWPGPDISISDFFARSNVTGLCGLIFNGYARIAHLLALAPLMRDLTLHGFSDRSQAPGVEAFDFLGLNISLNSLTLRRCFQLEVDEFIQFIKKLHLRMLIIQYCTFRDGDQSIEQDALRDELSALCPIVQFLPNEPDPVNKWCWLD